MKRIQLINSNEFMVVDDADYEWAKNCRWKLNQPYPGKKYAQDSETGYFAHRMVLEESGVKIEGKDVDHEDGDALNNTRENLRPCDDAQNQWNWSKTWGQSSFRGVSWHERDQKWFARISVRGERIQLGTFDIEEDAAKAYDEAAKKYHGEFARLNFQGPYLSELQRKAHIQAVKSGWWENDRSPFEIAALIHSEVSEFVEEARKGNPAVYYIGENGNKETTSQNFAAWKFPEGKKPEGQLIELADAVIRIMDYCGRMGWDLEAAIKLKMDYNATRPHRHGGKLA